ncbi:hypothetical protein BRETT_002048 [Brettanomyces bruxellensis]|uniref:Uncharacterized protein n=1 Tax=Dekkera bruxellensis TaxID=5007 RepID=A0A871RB55_DEKBR|nr:uncharacterized protein BRETT_002048 [Brettanomyces bruxellensis]QOU21884.1 hypothetical protein BRETT_002048 [Brettanomyces bruxellensis]
MDFAQYASDGKIPITLLQSMLADTFSPSEVRHLSKAYRPIKQEDQRQINDIGVDIQESGNFVDQLESYLESRNHYCQEPICMSSSSAHPVSSEGLRFQTIEQQPSSPLPVTNVCSSSMLVDSSMTIVNNESTEIAQGITLKDVETFLDDSVFEGSTLPVGDESSAADFPLSAITSSSERT